MTNREVALSLINVGLRIFPCNPDKTPRIKDWEAKASNSVLQIETWWNGADDLLPAIPTEPNRIVALDCDRKNGKDGVAAFQGICAAHSIDPSNAFIQETPSTGLHFWFRSDVAYSGQVGKLAPGIDVRSHVNYVIAPGATLPDGRAYRAVQGSLDSITPLPEALAALLKRKDTAEIF